MALTLYDKKPEIGDLIEIFRPLYQHWAVYIGDGFLIHLASTDAGCGASSMRSDVLARAVVKRERLWDVVKKDKWRINNLLDEEVEPRPAHVIIREAESRLNQVVHYSVVQSNCEHFVTELRYGKPQSRQVRTMEVGIGAGVAAIGVGLLALAAVLIGGGSKEKKSKSKR